MRKHCITYSFFGPIKKYQYRAKLSSAAKTKKAQEQALNLVPEDDTNVSENCEVFEQRIEECDTTIKSYCEDLWSLFEQLLDVALVLDWNKIVKRETATMVWIDKGRIRKNLIRGRSV